MSLDTSRASSGSMDALLLALMAVTIAEATPPRAANCWRSAAVQTALDVDEAVLAASDQFSAGAASIRRAPRRLALRLEILAASAASGSPVPLNTATASAVSSASYMAKSASNPRVGRASPQGCDAGQFSDELSTDCPAGSTRLQPALLSAASAAPLDGCRGVP